MKKFDLKSLAAGVIIGTLGITTAFAATGIKSAVLSDTAVTLSGSSLPLNKPLVSVTMDNEDNASLYMPAEELLQKLGYTVKYDETKNTVDLIPGITPAQEAIGATSTDGTVVINLANNSGQASIAASGAFQAEDNQTLTLAITSDIKGGSVDLFLFDPDGKEQRVTIGSVGTTVDILLKKGTWKYNCSGVFKDGGDIRVVGTVK